MSKKHTFGLLFAFVVVLIQPATCTFVQVRSYKELKDAIADGVTIDVLGDIVVDESADKDKGFQQQPQPHQLQCITTYNTRAQLNVHRAQHVPPRYLHAIYLYVYTGIYIPPGYNVTIRGKGHVVQGESKRAIFVAGVLNLQGLNFYNCFSFLDGI